MSIIELEPTTTEWPAWDLPPISPLTQTQEALIAIRRLVEDDHWIRDKTLSVVNGHERRCMAGHIRKQAKGKVGHPIYGDLYRIMNSAIGDEGKAEIAHYPYGLKVNGGTSRGTDTLCTFNNTRKDESEIIDWIDRALQL